VSLTFWWGHRNPEKAFSRKFDALNSPPLDDAGKMKGKGVCVGLCIKVYGRMRDYNYGVK